MYSRKKDFLSKEEDENDGETSFSFSKNKFNAFNTKYINETKKVVEDLKEDLIKIIEHPSFEEIFRHRNGKQTEKQKKRHDDIISFQFQMDRTLDLMEMEKWLIKNEVNLFEKELKAKSEEVMKGKYREETLHRKIDELRRQMKDGRSKSFERIQSLGNINKLRRIPSLARINNYGSVLRNLQILNWLDESKEFKSLEGDVELLGKQNVHIEVTVKKKEEAFKEERKFFDEKISEKKKTIRAIKERLKKQRNRKTGNVLLSKDIKELKQRIKTLEHEVVLLEKDKKEKLESLDGEVKSLKSKYAKVLAELAEKDKLLQKYRKGIAEGGMKVEERHPTGKVTILFADLQGSKKLWEHNIEMMSKTVRIHSQVIRKIISEFRGYEVKTEGDKFMIAFGSPFDALNFALKSQMELLKIEWPKEIFELPFCAEKKDRKGNLIWRGPRLRVGIHVGKGETIQDRFDNVSGRVDYFGPDVNRAARCEAASCGGEICVTQAFWNEIEEIFEKTVVPAKMYVVGSFKFKGMEKKAEIVRSIFPKVLIQRRGSLEDRSKKEKAKQEKKNPLKKNDSKEKNVGGESGKGTNEKTEEEEEMVFVEKPRIEKGMSNSSFTSSKSSESISSRNPEEVKKIQDGARLFSHVFEEQIKFAQRRFRDSFSKIENGVKNPQQMEEALDTILVERRRFHHLLSNFQKMMENMKSFFIFKTKRIRNEMLAEMKEEYKRLRKENFRTKKRKRERSVKSRYLAEYYKSLKAPVGFRRNASTVFNKNEADIKNSKSLEFSDHPSLPSLTEKPSKGMMRTTTMDHLIERGKQNSSNTIGENQRRRMRKQSSISSAKSMERLGNQSATKASPKKKRKRKTSKGLTRKKSGVNLSKVKSIDLNEAFSMKSL